VVLYGQAQCRAVGLGITLNTLDRRYTDWCSAAHQSVGSGGGASGDAAALERIRASLLADGAS